MPPSPPPGRMTNTAFPEATILRLTGPPSPESIERFDPELYGGNSFGARYTMAEAISSPRGTAPCWATA